MGAGQACVGQLTFCVWSPLAIPGPQRVWLCVRLVFNPLEKPIVCDTPLGHKVPDAKLPGTGDKRYEGTHGAH